MADQTTFSEVDKPLFDKMRERIAHGELLLIRDIPPGRRTGLFPRQFRTLLVDLYGENPAMLGAFNELPPFPAAENARAYLSNYLLLAKNIFNALEAAPIQGARINEGRVFIGHGRSLIWRELKDFLEGRLRLPWEEFNREAVAGYATSERLFAMLDSSSFAFLVMTGEDEHAGDGLHARQNVVHEIGLFQGRLGIRRAIILLDEGCAQFSSIAGLTYISFPRGRISACFEEVRRVLERESLI